MDNQDESEKAYMAKLIESEPAYRANFGVKYEAQEKAKRKTGRYTLEEAATELANKSGWEIDRWLGLIEEQIKAGKLPLKNPKDYSDQLPYPTPRYIRAYYDEVSADNVNAWLEKHPEWGDYRLGDAAPALALAPKSEAVKGITKNAVIGAFEGLHYNGDQWKKLLGDQDAKWLLPARVARGDKNTSALWNPTDIALALFDKNIPIKKLDAVFVALNDWQDEWKRKTEIFRQ